MRVRRKEEGESEGFDKSEVETTGQEDVKSLESRLKQLVELAIEPESHEVSIIVKKEGDLALWCLLTFSRSRRGKGKKVDSKESVWRSRGLFEKASEIGTVIWSGIYTMSRTFDERQHLQRWLPLSPGGKIGQLQTLIFSSRKIAFWTSCIQMIDSRSRNLWNSSQSRPSRAPPKSRTFDSWKRKGQRERGCLSNSPLCISTTIDRCLHYRIPIVCHCDRIRWRLCLRQWVRPVRELFWIDQLSFWRRWRIGSSLKWLVQSQSFFYPWLNKSDCLFKFRIEFLNLEGEQSEWLRRRAWREDGLNWVGSNSQTSENSFLVDF